METHKIMTIIKQVVTALEMNPSDSEVVGSCINELLNLYEALEQQEDN